MPDDLLSQNQIDALFSERAADGDDSPSLEGSAARERERFHSVRPYDFRRPSKLSKEQLRTLQMIFEGFARLVGTTLSGVLRSQVHLALVSVEQDVFGDYTRALPATTLLNLATADPLPGTFVFEYDLGTAFVMLDRYMGGIGKAPQSTHEVTEIEEALLQSISTIFLDAFSQSWQHIFPIEARLQRLEYSSRFLQVAPPNEVVVLLLFDLRIQEHQTTLSMCLPYSVIEPIAAGLNVQTLFAGAPGDGATEENADARHRLQRVMVPLVALLGTTALPLAAVNDLQVDDVIRLDGLASDPLSLSVNGKPTYVARPGLAHGHIAVQILGVLHEGDDPA